jgi:hypothetical protein
VQQDTRQATTKENQMSYNGWTNYETWRVNLEMFDGTEARSGIDEYNLGQEFREYAEEVIEQSAPPGFARDYALAFLSDVNWREIAGHYIEEEEEAA